MSFYDGPAGKIFIRLDSKRSKAQGALKSVLQSTGGSVERGLPHFDEGGHSC